MTPVTSIRKSERRARGYEIATTARATITRAGAFFRVPSSTGKGFYSVDASSRELQQLVFKRELCQQIIDRNFFRAVGCVLAFPLAWLRSGHSGELACTCPDHKFRQTTCKHIAAVAFFLTALPEKEPTHAESIALAPGKVRL